MAFIKPDLDLWFSKVIANKMWSLLKLRVKLSVVFQSNLASFSSKGLIRYLNSPELSLMMYIICGFPQTLHSYEPFTSFWENNIRCTTKEKDRNSPYLSLHCHFNRYHVYCASFLREYHGWSHDTFKMIPRLPLILPALFHWLSTPSLDSFVMCRNS